MNAFHKQNFSHLQLTLHITPLWDLLDLTDITGAKAKEDPSISRP
jgi:hypothetical protein